MSSTPQPHPSPVAGQPQLMPHPQQPSPGAASVQQHQQHIPITLSAQQHQQLMAQPQTMQYQGVEVTVHQAPPAIAPAPMAVTPTGQHVNQQGMYSQAIQQHPGVGAAPMSQLIQQAAATSMASMPTQVQVIQQPMNPTYLQHMYSPQGPLIMGNVVHQPGLGGSIQLIAAGKPINGTHMISGGKAVLQQSQGGFAGGYTIPTSNNGTLVMLSQANLLQTQSKQNDLAKMAAAAGQRLPIHKQLAVSGAVSVQHQTMQHQTQHPQLVTTQAGGHHGHHQLPMMASSSQIISPLQAFGQMPQGWGTMPQAFYIRPTGAPGGAGGQTQEGMFIQSPPQHPQLQQPQMSADPNQLRFPTAVTSMASVTQAVQPQQLQQPQPAVQQPAAAVMTATKPTIQPKLAAQRPLILPNMQTGSPMRPGGMVGPAMGMQQQQPRPQHKGRMKPAASRMVHPNPGAAGGGLVPPRTPAPPLQQMHQPRLTMPTSGVAPMSTQLLPSGSPNPDGSAPATLPVAALKPRASPKPKSPKSSSTAAAAAAAAASIQQQLQHQQAVAASAAGVVRPQQLQQQVHPVSQQQHIRVTSSGVTPMMMTAPVSRTTVASSVASSIMPPSSMTSPQFLQTSSATVPSNLTTLSSSSSSLNYNGGLSTTATAVGAVSEITMALDGTPLPATLSAPPPPAAPHGRASTPSSVGLPPQQSPAMTLNSHALPPRATPINTAAPSTKRLQNGEVKALPGMASIGADTKGKVPLPKAMVKPHVLTHVIDGFVIQEAAEPFPVNKGVSCDSKTITGKENHPETDVDSKKRSNGVVGVGCSDGPLGQGSADAKKKIKRDKAHVPPTSPAAAGATAAAATPSGKKHGRKNSEQSSDSAASPPAAKRPRTAADPGGPDAAESPDHCLAPAALDALEAGDGASMPQDKNSSAEPTINSDKPNPITWNVDDVVDFIRNLPGCGDYAEDFALQEIDGQALMLLRADHLMQAMSIRLGPALKICAKIDSMRAALQPQQ